MSEDVMFKESAKVTIDSNLIERMEKIVNSIIVNPKFHSDFYLFDLKSIESCPRFAWYVYDCGTHFIPLNSYDDVMEFQSEWVTGMKDITDKTLNDRLYLCDFTAGKINRILYANREELISNLKAAV